MSYRVLAQKYRPQTFEDVIGQETVTRTLKNSVLQGRIANAYIFCGPRGVGKTTIARLLAKTINCENPPEKSPCNKCASCQEITRGASIDVMEIDGASNNRVDEIRVLLDNVQFSPSKSKYKIYIIDEVHMLSPGAFNALLKTLEEPPGHVKFIFATTENHKVLPTIMSRCQRFDFKRIPPREIFERITDIAGREKINIDKDASLLIARSADGSLRDALVILDQMVSFSSGKITPGDVVELLGMVSKDKVFDLADAVINNDAPSALNIVDGFIDNGKDPVFIANTLINHFRDIMILKNTREPTADMAFSSDEKTRLDAQLAKLSQEEVLYILQNLSHSILLIKNAMMARAPLEITLVRLTKRSEMLSLSAILDELKKKDMISPDDGSSGGRPAAFSRQEKTLPSQEDIPAQKKNAVRQLQENYQSEDDDLSGLPVEGEINWPAVLKYVKNKKMSLFTFLSPARPVEVNKGKAVIGFGKEHSFNKEVLESESNRRLIEEAFLAVSGKPLRVEFTILEFLGEKNPGIEEKKAIIAETREKMKPVVEKAMDIFGGHVVRDLMEES